MQSYATLPPLVVTAEEYFLGTVFVALVAFVVVMAFTTFRD